MCRSEKERCADFLSILLTKIKKIQQILENNLFICDIYWAQSLIEKDR